MSSPAKSVDLVLEGGGVKGLGLVGAVTTLAAAGYEFPRVAGASAGAIVATLLAALRRAGRAASDLEQILPTIDYKQFAPHGLFADAEALARFATHRGLYDGSYLVSWLSSQLEPLGVHTFGDLRIADDSAPVEQRYALVVTTSDLTRGKSVRLPWDYAEYGLAPDSQRVVDAVRASMAIPFFFTPVTVRARPDPTAAEPEPAGTCTWVDGGLLDNFPVDVFGDTSSKTLGIKLSAEKAPPPKVTGNPISEALAMLETLVDNADRFYVTPDAAKRTIFVDTTDMSAVDFGLSPAQQQTLLANGRAAATAFLNAQH